MTTTFFTSLAALPFLLFSYAAFAETIIRTQILMGNIPVSVSIDTAQSRRGLAIGTMEKAFAEAKRVENTVSEWREESDATRLNQNAGKAWVPIGKDMRQILLLSRDISEKTDGAFDITFPSSDRQATYRDILLEPELSLAFLPRKGMRIAVSGIAKGYIVDRMSDVLKKAGFKKYLINAGDIYAQGRWTVGIRDPDGPPEAFLCQATLENQAISTSGNYERGPHLIDPTTKKPALGFKSLTVIAQKAALADALGTGLFVAGPVVAPCLLSSFSEITVLIFDTAAPPHCVRLPPSKTDECRRF